jgi:N-acetylgalactosamine-6-sulfatase
MFMQFQKVAIISLLVSSLAPGAAGNGETSAQQTPNIVLFLADDLGYGDLGCYGATDIRTPVIDRLAAEGVRFTQFYANGPECSPTRTALLTGRYQQRIGGLECAIGTGNVGRYDDAIRLRETHDLGLPESEATLGQMLKGAGYQTGLFGKWHLGYEPKFAPQHHGFDRALYCVGGEMDYFHYVEPAPTGHEYVLRRDGEQYQGKQVYYTDLIAEEAERFVAESSAQPFFLYVPFTAPHSPFQGPAEHWESPLPHDSPRWPQGNAPPQIYAEMIESLDAAVGRILAALDARGISDNTLVIFTSDNGGTDSARPTGLRGNKGTTFEGGIRVPCIVKWPETFAAGITTDQVSATFDLTASILRIAGASVPDQRPIDGWDLLGTPDCLRNNVSRTLFWRGRRGASTWKGVRDGSLKYVERYLDGKLEVCGLFDLIVDLGEQNDLKAERPEDWNRMKELLANWEADVRPQR